MMRVARSALATIAAIVACDNDEPAVLDPGEDYIRAPSVSIVSIARDPARHDGQTIRLEGEVDTRLGPHVVIVRGRGLLWAATILVVAAAPDAFGAIPPVEGDDVEVRGIVRTRMTPELSRELGTVSDAIDDGPFVVASQIRRQP